MKRYLGVTAVLATITGAISIGAAPAQAADPVYTITAVTKAELHNGSASPTACSWKGAADLALSVRSSVTDATWDGQVSVTGLKARVSAGSKVLGTFPVYDAYLEPDGPSGANFLDISCRAWRSALQKGFGGPRETYSVRILGTGQAWDTNDGSSAGSVVADDQAFDIAVPQFATWGKIDGKKSGDRVKLSTTMKSWAKAGGKFSWQPLRRTKVSLIRYTGAGKPVRVATARTRSTGTVTLAFRPRRSNYVRLRLTGFTYPSEATYEVTKRGKVTLLADH